MTVTLNGADVVMAAPTSVTDIVVGLGHDPSLPGVAVAIDGEVIRRADWASTEVTDGAVVEVLTAVQGGA